MPRFHSSLTPDELHVAGPPTIVRAASTANVTLASAVENGDTLDGITLATGDRILLKNQTTGSENGIYVVASSSAPTRATDFNTATKMREGLLIRVRSGTANADTLWQHTTSAAITVGTTALTFAAVGTGGGGSGTVTSVGLTMPSDFSVSGSPVTTAGTLAVTAATQSANTVKAGPTTGSPAAPTYRALVSADLPSAPTVSGEVTASDFKPSGLTGAVSASRYVGATASVAPTTGTFVTGDWVVTQNGKVYVCTAGGSPGTWTQVGAGGAASMTIQEVDTSPSVSATTLIFPNGTLTDNGGGSVTYTPAGGGSPTTLDVTVSNNTGSTIAAGKAVNFNDAVTASYPRVTPTAADGVDTPGQGYPLGITLTSISNGGTGTVRVFGVVDSLDTHLFAVGDDVQGGASGAIEALNNNPWLGLVLVSDASAGKIFVGNSLLNYNIPTHTHFNNSAGGIPIVPWLTVYETAAASVTTPPAGEQNVFVDTADHKLKRKDSSGTVTIIGQGVTSLVNQAHFAAAGSYSFDAGTSANRVLHCWPISALTSYAGVSGHTLITVKEIIAPASGVNTLVLSAAATVWVVDGVNQDNPLIIEASHKTTLLNDTTPYSADTDMYCVTLKLTPAGTTSITPTDAGCTVFFSSTTLNSRNVAGRLGTGVPFDCRWTVNGTLAGAGAALIYRPFGVPLAQGWYGIGSNYANQEIGANNTFVGDFNLMPVVATTPVMTKISSNNGGMCAGVDSSGNAYTWGTDNGSGMLCDGSIHVFGFGEIPVPTLVSGITGVTDCAVGNLETFWLKSDGTVWYFGLYINNLSTNHTSAFQVSGLSNIVRIEAADECVLALDNSGQLWFVGQQYGNGVAGNGSASGNVSTPYNVLSNVVDFSIAEINAVACNTSGVVYCWGKNSHKATGQGTTVGTTTTPSTVAGPSNVIKVAALDEPCTLAITSTNQVWFWGGNAFGERGNGTESFSVSVDPEQITMPAGETWEKLIPNFRSFECYAITASRKVYAWGANFFGASARNGYADVLTPTQILPSLITGVTAMCNMGDDGWLVYVTAVRRGRSFAQIIY